LTNKTGKHALLQDIERMMNLKHVFSSWNESMAAKKEASLTKAERYRKDLKGTMLLYRWWEVASIWFHSTYLAASSYNVYDPLLLFVFLVVLKSPNCFSVRFFFFFKPKWYITQQKWLISYKVCWEEPPKRFTKLWVCCHRAQWRKTRKETTP